MISGLRDLRALLALCLRGSRGAGSDAHFTFSFAYCLLQRLHESHQNISFSLNLELGKNSVIQLPKFLWPGRLNSTDKLSVCSYGVSEAIQQRKKLNFSVCTETPVEML